MCKWQCVKPQLEEEMINTSLLLVKEDDLPRARKYFQSEFSQFAGVMVGGPEQTKTQSELSTH